ncbi:MAG: riboflavin synthase [Betaproteobacteria bacterium]|nr:riboflavin synthase [Betaproteobacteria bacterium]
MFTGIVEALGRIEAVEPLHDGVRITVNVGDWPIEDLAIGDSVAHNGACLTVVAKAGRTLSYELSAETLRCTTGLDRLGPVNLEQALRFGDRLGGHLVSGHVDGVGRVLEFRQVAESWLLRLEAPQELAKFIARKGSITVNGVSLTVNQVEGPRFAVNLIPHTCAVTTLGQLRAGDAVNLEVDLLARYLERLVGER